MSDTQKPNQGNREGGNRRPRRNNNNNNRNRNNNSGGGNNRNRNRNRSNRPPKPLVLTFWQKILKAVGCLDEDKLRKQQRDQQRAKKDQKKSTNTTAPKSNVRNAKTGQDKPKGDKPPRRRAPQKVAVDSARLYVGNLSYDATEYDLEDLFKGVGTVKKVELIYNRNTHKSKGYGFIQMLNKEEAERAVEVLHDQPFMGRQLVVNGSKSRKEGDTSGADFSPSDAAAE